MFKQKLPEIPHECEWRDRAGELESTIQSFQREVAFEDPASKVGNARQFERDARKWFSFAARTGLPVSVALVDVTTSDNERQVSDAVFDAVAALLVGDTRDHDCAALLEPGTFALILPGCERKGAASVVERLGRAFAQARVESDGHALFLAAAAGTAQFHPGESVDGVVDAARASLAGDSATLRSQRAWFQPN